MSIALPQAQAQCEVRFQDLLEALGGYVRAAVAEALRKRGKADPEIITIDVTPKLREDSILCGDLKLCGAPKPRKKRAPRLHEYTPEFEAMWEVYPRPEAKALGLKAWNARLNDGTGTVEIMLQAARNYAVDQDGSLREFIMLPSTFFGSHLRFVDFIEGIPETNSFRAVDMSDEAAKLVRDDG